MVSDYGAFSRQQSVIGARQRRSVCWQSDWLSSEGSSEGIFRRRAFALIYGHGQRSDVKV
jgi:hypothetical protein